MNYKFVLSVDFFLSWRRCDTALEVRVMSGDLAILSISPNGHDAQAKTFGVNTGLLHIQAGYWYTIESLGRRSCVVITGDLTTQIVEADDWKPTPRNF